jgi:hypothetical protein
MGGEAQRMAGANGQHPGAGIGRLPEVRESEASPEVQAIFTEITRTVRVPYVGLLWRVLAADPPVLRAAWRAVAPNLCTLAAERAADQLRERALIVEAAGIASHKAFKGDLARAEIDYDLRIRIANFNHMALYALPKHLLAAVMLSEALAGRQPVGGGDAQEIPPGPVPGAVAVTPVDPTVIRGRAAELLPAIAAAHGHPVVEDYFRGLARLPDYLAAAWNALKPVVRDEVYDERGRELVATARAAYRALPHPVPFPDNSVPPARAGEIGALLSLFAERILPDVLIDVAIITALTDGPDARGRHPFAP